MSATKVYPADPCNAEEAVARARKALTQGGEYKLGAGDYRRSWTNPWTGTPPASDCSGFAISWCWRIPRYRPGFGSQRSVVDWVNSDSAIDDARHRQELFAEVFHPRPGDLIAYPSVRINGKRLIGHVGLVEHVPDNWLLDRSKWAELTIIQCKGPTGRKPAVIRTDGSLWDRRDAKWPKPEHRTVLLCPHTRLA